MLKVCYATEMNNLISRIVINTLLGIVLIYTWTRFVNIEEVWQKLIIVNPLILIAIVACYATSTVMRSMRFKILLPDKNISLVQLTLLTYLGQLLTFIIPFRIGEFAKGIYIANSAKKPLPTAILWVFVDRLVDFWVVISLVGILLLSIQTAIPTNINLIIGGLAICLASGIAVTVYYPILIKKIAVIVLSIVFIKRLRTLLLKFTDYIINSFSILKVSPQKQIIAVSVTAFSWIFESLTWYLAFMSLGIIITPLAAILGTMLMALSFILPSAPGYLGSLQAAGLLVFSLWLGLNSVDVSAATILIHISIMLYVLIAGVSSLYFLKLNLGDLFKQFKNTKL